MSGANRRYILAFVYIALASLLIAIGRALWPGVETPSIIELWIAFMVLHVFIGRQH